MARTSIQFQLIRTIEQNSKLKDVDMTTRHLFVIDSGIANHQELIRELPIDSEWVLLDAQHDGVLQLQDILENHAQLNSLHILSHGTQGSFRLGNTALSSQNIERYADALIRIGSCLNGGGDILLYGCDVGLGEEGASFVERLAQLTGADVAASSNATGSPDLGGDWILEIHAGAVETSALDSASSAALLTANTAPTLTIDTAPPTTYEIEYNDVQGFATPFTSAAIGGLSGSDDVDWFSVRLDELGLQAFSFDTSTMNFGLWTVSWYDSRMQVISTRSSGPSNGTASTTYEFPVSSAGTYYVQVRATDPGLYNGGLYTFSLSNLEPRTYKDTEADDAFAPKFGRLIGRDIDPGTTLTYGVETGTDHGSTVQAKGAFGSLSVSKTNGLFTYTPEDGAIESLKNDATETFTMTVSDGTEIASATYALNIIGADDPTSFGGTTSGAVSGNGPTTVGGTLTATDRDLGDAAIIGQQNTVGAYGRFSIGSSGNWSYELSVYATNVQALALGQTSTDTFRVSTAGGMTQDIVVTIRGTNAFITGGEGDDLLIGTSLDDQMVGLAGNDTLSGAEGNDKLDGGPGIDTARFGGLREHFQLTIVPGHWSVQDLHGVEGIDQLTNIERLRFSDKKIALDLGPAEHAGQAVAIAGVLAPSLIQVPPALGAILGLIDEGSSVLEVFQLAIDVGLVNEIAGADTNTALAQMVFRNVTGGDADAEMTDWLVSFMDGRNADFSQAQFLATISALEINRAHIDLVGLQQTGLEYL